MPGVILQPDVPDTSDSNLTTLSQSSAGKLQISVGGAAPVDVGGGSGSSSLAAAYAYGLLNSPASANAYSQYSTDTLGTVFGYRKARGTSGAPTVVVNTDRVSTNLHQAYDGSAYLAAAGQGAFVTRGATVAGGSVPLNLWWHTAPTGIDQNPSNTGAQLGMQLVSNGVLALNFPGNTTAAGYELPGTSNHETACISVFGPDSQGPLSTAFSQFRHNSAGVPTYNGGLFWEYYNLTSNTAGSEYTQFGVEVMSAGQPVTAFRVQAVAAASGIVARACMPIGGVAGGNFIPGIAWSTDLLSGWSLVAGPVANDVYYHASLTGTTSQVSTMLRHFSVTPGAVQTEFHIPGDASGYTCGPNRSGLFSDVNNSNIYLNAIARSVCIGAAGALLPAATSGFLGLPTMSGTPTGSISTLMAGKSAAVVDDSAFKVWINFGGNNWKFIQCS